MEGFKSTSFNPSLCLAGWKCGLFNYNDADIYCALLMSCAIHQLLIKHSEVARDVLKLGQFGSRADIFSF